MARWVEIAARRPVDEPAEKPRLAGGVSKGGRGKKGGIEQASRDLGIPATNIRKAVKIASLSPEAKAAGRDAPQAALLAAAKETEPAAQVAAIEAHIAKGRPVEPDPEGSCGRVPTRPQHGGRRTVTTRGHRRHSDMVQPGIG